MDESWKYFGLPLPGIRDGIRLSIMVRDRLTFPLFVFHGGGEGKLFLGQTTVPLPSRKRSVDGANGIARGSIFSSGRYPLALARHGF